MSEYRWQQTRRHHQLFRFSYDYLRTVLRTEWQLGLLAVVGLAPGVATLMAWSNLAVALHEQRSALLLGWLLPEIVLEQLGAEGVLIGAAMVTLLIGCLGLTNAYLASLSRRRPQLLLLRHLGLRQHELLGLLSLEALAIGLLGSGMGIALGYLLSLLTWGEAVAYLGLPFDYRLTPVALTMSAAIGTLAALLFLGTAARLTFFPTMSHAPPSLDQWRKLALQTSWLGASYGLILTLLAAMLILPLSSAVLLAFLAGLVGSILNGGGWLLTHLYARLPLSAQRPLWTIAVQGLARHPNHTAGMTLALAAGAYAVGMAGLSWLSSSGFVRFPFWVAGLILLSGAVLVFTVAALALVERRTELAMLRALGARRRRLWQLVLLEYGIVAVGGGAVGAAMALVSWIAAGQREQWPIALTLIAADLLGALLSAWIGAAPVLWYLTRPRLIAASRSDDRM